MDNNQWDDRLGRFRCVLRPETYRDWLKWQINREQELYEVKRDLEPDYAGLHMIRKQVWIEALQEYERGESDIKPQHPPAPPPQPTMK